MVSSKRVIQIAFDPTRQYVYKYYDNNTATRTRLTRVRIDDKTVVEQEGDYTEVVSVLEFDRIKNGIRR